jgi:hypothetical protein
MNNYYIVVVKIKAADSVVKTLTHTQPLPEVPAVCDIKNITLAISIENVHENGDRGDISDITRFAALTHTPVVCC